MAAALLLIQLASSLFMTGLVWLVQIAHYPLFDRVGAESFPRYCRDNIALTGRIAAPVMAIELLTAFAMVWIRPAEIPLRVVLLGLGLLGVIWTSTFAVQWPMHRRFSRGEWKQDRLPYLLGTNWLRTIAWTVRSVGLLILVGRLIESNAT